CFLTVMFVLSLLAFSAPWVLASVTELSFPVSGATGVLATGMNDRRQIVGTYSRAGVAHGFLLDNGVVTTIDGPVGTLSISLRAINNRSQIVGSYLDAAAANHSFLWEKSSMSEIRVPGAATTLANGINDRGQIVGTRTDGSGVSHCFLFEKNDFKT